MPRAAQKSARGAGACRRVLVLRDGVEALSAPAAYAADHDLHRQPQLREAQRAALRAVAMRSCTIDDEQGAVRIGSQTRADELAVRDIEGAGHMAGGEFLRAAHVDEHEIGA